MSTGLRSVSCVKHCDLNQTHADADERGEQRQQLETIEIELLIKDGLILPTGSSKIRVTPV